MERYFQQPGSWSFVHLTALVAGLVLVVQTTGCALRRPTSLAVTQGRVAAPSNCPGPDSSLRLVTFNILGLPSWMTGAVKDRYPQICRELERLDADIILLQEAWTAKARTVVPADGSWSVARARGQHTFFQQSGLVTLSKYPIIGGAFYPFTREAFPDRLVSKGALKVTVQLQDGRVLNVWNVHLQKGGALDVQRAQVRELVSHVQAAEDNQIADLIGGDFNCTPASALYRELERSLGPSVHQIGGVEPFLTWIRLSGRPLESKTLDYIFVKARVPLQELQAVPRAIFAAATPEQRLSDHLGIEAVVKLKPATRLVEAAGLSQDSGALPMQLGGGE